MGGATETLYLHLWNTAFQDFQMGLASSIGYVMAIAILVLSAITLRGSRSEAT